MTFHSMTHYNDPEYRRLIDEPAEPFSVGYFQKIVGLTDNKGFFSFNPAQMINFSRCDEGFWGPMSFHFPADGGGCNCGNIDTNETPIQALVCSDNTLTAEHVRFSCPFLSLPPYGYICYQEMQDPDVEENFRRMHWTSNARTLQELFKMIIEWDDCYNLLEDRSIVAVTAHDFLGALQVPESIEAWLRAEVPDQQVFRFLAGDSNARDRNTSVPGMTDEMSHWLWTEVIHWPMVFGPTSRQP